MNEGYNKIEVFSTENEVLQRVDELKARGATANDITVVSEHADDATMITDRGDVHYEAAEGSFGDKFASFFSGEEPEERVLEQLNLSEGEKQRYINDLKEGKYLLYTDSSYSGQTDDTTGTATTGTTSTTTAADRPTDDYVANDEERDDIYASGTTHQPNEADNLYGNTAGRNDNVDRNTTGLNDTTDRTTPAADINRDTTRDTTRGTDRDDKEKMELHEEKVDVDKNRRKAGEVEINKETIREKEEFDVPVTKEEVTVERRPVNEERSSKGEFSNKDGVYEDNDSIHVPVHEEEVEVNKKDVVKEEIVVDKKQKKENVHVDEEVRREEADVSDTTDNRRRDDDNDLRR